MAGRFPPAWLDELRSRAEIVQTISAYVPLKKNGNRYWGLCPFHGEKTPSFSVTQDQQLFYCFGCKAGGTVIQFIMDIERLSFQEAVTFLAERVHLPLPEMLEDQDWQRRHEQRERLLTANREAAKWYHQKLYQPEGKEALNYLKNRGLSDAVIKRFGLGAAPNQWNALTQYMLSLGFKENELKLCGLTNFKESNIEKKSQEYYDMFRGRAMFPIIDQYGNVLAFGGRIIHDGKPKYLNTADTPVFNKRLGVYAANLLRKERHLERVILVEGYMDVVSLSQFGVKGVCATLGTALTIEQARLLRRFAPQVYLAYDGDSAGQHAILRGLDILQEAGVPARVLDFPDGMDPDEFIRREGIEGFQQLHSVTPETYRLRRLREQQHMDTQEGRTQYAREAAKILKDLDPVELENQLRELAEQTGFSREILVAQIEKTEPRLAQNRSLSAQPTRVSSISKQDTDGIVHAQEVLIGLLATGKIPISICAIDDFDDPVLRQLYEDIAHGMSAAALVEEQATEEERTYVTKLLQATMVESVDQMLKVAQDNLAGIRRHKLMRKIKSIEDRIDTLQGVEKQDAMKEFVQLNQQLQRTKSPSDT